jgi:hypothetical protein
MTYQIPARMTELPDGVNVRVNNPPWKGGFGSAGTRVEVEEG